MGLSGIPIMPQTSLETQFYREAAIRFYQAGLTWQAAFWLEGETKNRGLKSLAGGGKFGL